MNEPPRKKRRTLSPRERERSSSPLKKPPRRPSFASPTKASLARFNPDLIASTLRKQTEGLLGRGKQDRAFISSEQSGNAQGSLLAQDEEAEATAGAEQPLPKDRRATPSPRGAEALNRGTALVEGLDEEPEPPTISLTREMERESPRGGVLFSSPSKRPPRLRNFAKSSHIRPKQPVSREDGEVDATAGAAHAETLATKERDQPNPELEKKKREKEDFLRELGVLKSDIANSVDWIHKLQDNGSFTRLDRREQDDIISFINRVNDSDTLTEDEKLPPISSLLTSFLPYQVRPVSLPQKQDDPEDPVPSHRPVELEDPLPYLQLFTAFKCNSRASIPDSEDLDPELKEWGKKTTFDFEGPQKIFTSSIDATIDTRNHQVVELRVSWASSWAATELLKFIYVKEQEKDLGCISWAMNSYWELAKKRAIHWHKCETEFANLIAGRTNEDKENFSRGNGKRSTNMSRKDLVRYLGRDNIVLQNKHVRLKLSWCIGFDWTGEAESTLTVEPAYPQVWSEADRHASLKMIPETFDSLVRLRGAFGATKIIVALLFED